jgi:hypothetical protein
MEIVARRTCRTKATDTDLYKDRSLQARQVCQPVTTLKFASAAGLHSK